MISADPHESPDAQRHFPSPVLDILNAAPAVRAITDAHLPGEQASQVETDKTPTSRRAEGRARVLPTQAIEFYAIGINALLILLLTISVLEVLHVTSLSALAASAGLLLFVILGVLAVGGLIVENVKRARIGTHNKKSAPKPPEKDLLDEALAAIAATEPHAPGPKAV